MNDEYEPHSWNAMFSRVLSRLDNQDIQSGIYRAEVKESLAKIEALLLIQNGRVKKLELWRSELTAKVAIIVLLVGGASGILSWVIPLWLKK